MLLSQTKNTFFTKENSFSSKQTGISALAKDNQPLTNNIHPKLPQFPIIKKPLFHPFFKMCSKCFKKSGGGFSYYSDSTVATEVSCFIFPDDCHDCDDS